MNRLSLTKEIEKIFKAEQESQVKADKMAEKLEGRITGDDVSILIEDMLLRTKDDLSKSSYKYLWAGLIYDRIKSDLLAEKVKSLAKEEKAKFLGFISEIFNHLKEIQDSGSFDNAENDCNPYMVFKSFFDKVPL